MPALFDEETYPYPAWLSDGCKAAIRWCIRSCRETHGFLAHPSLDGSGVDFHLDNGLPDIQGSLEYAAFDS
ncbi:MAG: hypothetical protein V1745_02620 [Patescibacteria group bacterium]